MRSLASFAGLLLLAVVLLDAFQTIILPRRPVGRLRITRIFFLLTWSPWRWCVRRVRSRNRREQLYSIYGPLSLLVLFLFWALLLIAGYALVFFGLRIPFHDPLLIGTGEWARLGSCLYVSGTTLFTLGLGDVLPQSRGARLMTVLEAGTGLGFVALVIGYLPVLYASFSQREVLIALLDARAGSPPSALEVLLRHDFQDGRLVLRSLLAEWERWCAEVLETHVSYPILCYYRSQHDNQSWLAALTTVVDTCALLIAALGGEETRQAQLTFAIGRHTLVDLGHVFQREAAERRLHEAARNRLDEAEFARMLALLRSTGYPLGGDEEVRQRLQALRKLYEPSAAALSDYFCLDLPAWMPPTAREPRQSDAWNVVHGLPLSAEALAARLTRHISPQSTAAHLESHGEVPGRDFSSKDVRKS